MRRLWRDFVCSARSLAKSPGLAAVAILTLALSIGANASIFSILDPLLLRNAAEAGEGIPYSCSKTGANGMPLGDAYTARAKIISQSWMATQLIVAKLDATALRLIV
jgi:hypothetical protein